MIIARAAIDLVWRAAEAAYPEECCGLLVGHRRADGTLVVSDAAPAANVTAHARRDSFEIDPRVRFDLTRRLRETGDSIVGHYHSHPDEPALPSPRDLQHAYEPDLVWLIIAVRDGRATDSRAHRLDDSRERFVELPLIIGGCDAAPGA